MPGRPRERITEGREREIIELISNWRSDKKLSRQALAEEVEKRLGVKLTRQGLMKRNEIRQKFEELERKLESGRSPRAEKEPLTLVLERRIEELQQSGLNKDAVLARYQDLLVTYRYNARRLGISAEQLEAPIPARNRSQSSLDSREM